MPFHSPLSLRVPSPPLLTCVAGAASALAFAGIFFWGGNILGCGGSGALTARMVAGRCEGNACVVVILWIGGEEGLPLSESHECLWAF